MQIADAHDDKTFRDLDRFLQFTLPEQLVFVRTGTVKWLRRMERLNRRKVRRGLEPTMAEDISAGICRRMGQLQRHLEALLMLPERARIDDLRKLCVAEVHDLLTAYVVWCKRERCQMLSEDCHAVMLEIVSPNFHRFPRSRDFAAVESTLPPEELQARLSVAPIDPDRLAAHLDEYEAAEKLPLAIESNRRKAILTQRLVAFVRANRKDQ